MSLKLSIVIPVLNSHEVVRRQLLHFDKIGFPNNAELLLIDDGSDPPLDFHRPYLTIVKTFDTRPWTWAKARNFGATLAGGRHVLMTDIDYILSRELLEDALQFNGDKMRFRREFGVLDEDGNFTQDHKVLMEYGLSAERIANRGTKMPPHPNNFVMRRDLFCAMGGYREDLSDRPYPQGEDRHFKWLWTRWLERGRVKDSDHRPTIYMFPNGQFCGDVDCNPFGLFHDLSRKTQKNPWHKKILAGQRR